MPFPTDDILLGPASFGKLHRLDGMIWHTGEEPGFTRAYAVKTATWQLSNPGSYNLRIYDRASDPRGVMLNVPYLEASGGINPSSTAWAPGRYPFLERELARSGICPVRGCPGPYRNPTMHHLQVSFVGRTAALNAGDAPANFVPDARALIEWAEERSIRGPAPLVHSAHGHWQSNRSDPGAILSFVAGNQEDPMALVYFKPATGKVAAGTNVLTAPNGSVATTLAGGPAVVLGELPGGAPEWLLLCVGARTDDFGRELATTVPDAMGWIPRSRFTFDVSPINKPYVERVGAALYSDDPIGGDAAELTKLQSALDTANKRTATVKTAAAASLRKGAAANRDTAAGLEAAAKNVESL